MTWPCYIENRIIMRRVIMRLKCSALHYHSMAKVMLGQSFILARLFLASQWYFTSTYSTFLSQITDKYHSSENHHHLHHHHHHHHFQFYQSGISLRASSRQNSPATLRFSPAIFFFYVRQILLDFFALAIRFILFQFLTF